MSHRFWMPPHALQEQVEAVRTYYPDVSIENTRVNGGRTRRLSFEMRPVPLPDHLRPVLADLRRGDIIAVGMHGRVSHSPNCGAEGHPQHDVGIVGLDASAAFALTLTLPPRPLGSAGPRQPRARVLRPEISAATDPGHPHMYSDGAGDSWACPLSP